VLSHDAARVNPSLLKDKDVQREEALLKVESVDQVEPPLVEVVCLKTPGDVEVDAATQMYHVDSQFN